MYAYTCVCVYGCGDQLNIFKKTLIPVFFYNFFRFLFVIDFFVTSKCRLQNYLYYFSSSVPHCRNFTTFFFCRLDIKIWISFIRSFHFLFIHNGRYVFDSVKQRSSVLMCFFFKKKRFK